MKLKHTAFLFLSLLVAAAVQASEPALLGPNATVSFDAGTYRLSDSAKAKLGELIKQARAVGKIDEVQLAVWSDNPAPRPDEQLSRADRELASKREKAVREYLKHVYKIDTVDSYNMGERASWLAKTFGTDEAEFKDEIGRGGNEPMTKEEFKVFKDNGQPSKAVALIIYKKS